MTRWIVDIVRYYPIIANVYILAITGMAILGSHINVSIYSYTFIGQNFITNILLYYLSVKFRFCKLHRLLIWNMSLCLLFETVKNFGVAFSYSKITITTTSIVLLILIIDLIWKKAQKKVL